MSRVKVAHFFKRLDMGGAEMRTIQLMEYLSESVEPVFIVSSRQPGALEQRVIEAGGEIVRLRLGLLYGPRLWLLLRRRRVDVVHSHVALFSGVINFVAYLAGVRGRITHFRSDGNRTASTTRRLVRRIERFFVDHFSTAVVGVSPGSLTFGYRSDWQALEHTQVVPNGLEMQRREHSKKAAPSSHAISLVHIGRPTADKRRAFLGEVINELVGRGVDVSLTFVGEPGADTERAKAMTDAAGNGQRIRAVGVVDDPLPLLAESDLLVLPSRREGLPGVVLEALSVGINVVAADLPGVRYIAEHCDGIATVPADATAEEWAEVIAESPQWCLPSVQITSSFASSPFSLSRTAPIFLGLYEAAR